MSCLFTVCVYCIKEDSSKSPAHVRRGRGARARARRAARLLWRSASNAGRLLPLLAQQNSKSNLVGRWAQDCVTSTWPSAPYVLPQTRMRLGSKVLEYMADRLPYYQPIHVCSRSNAKHYGSYFNIPHHHSLCSSTFSSSWLSSWYTHGRKWTLSRKTSERRFIASIRRVTNAGASNW